MKKLLFLLFAICVAMQCRAVVAVGRVVYDLDEATRTATVARSTGYSGSIVIPDKIEYDDVTYVVNAIAKQAFYQCEQLRSVVIGDNVQTIGGSAFCECKKLQSVTIGQSVKTIEGAAFMYCESLEHLDIPDSVEAVSSGAFNYCTSLVDVHVGKKANAVNYGADGQVGWFCGCGSLMDIEVDPENPNLQSVDGYMLSKTKVRYLVDSPVGRPEINIPAEVDALYAYSCSHPTLEKVTVPEGVTRDNGAFRGSEMLKFIIEPSTMTSCVNYFDSGVMNFPLYLNPSILKVVKLSEWDLIGDYAFDRSSGALAGYVGFDTDITLPESYNGAKYDISDQCFVRYNYLTSVHIPAKVKSIGKKAFYWLANLTEVTMDDGVTSIGEEAFYGCQSLANLRLSGKLNVIGTGAFRNCYALLDFDMPQNVIEIGSLAFYDCKSLRHIELPPYLGLIQKDLMAGCVSLESVTMGDDVIAVGDRAFAGCLNLKEVNLAHELLSIGDRAFYNCRLLTDITLPPYLESIGEMAFRIERYDAPDGCWGLTSLVIPESVKTIGRYAFGSSNISSLTLHGGLNNVGEYAFSDIPLPSLVIPEGIASLPTNVFKESGLESVTLPSTLTEIGAGAFANCANLHEVINHSSLPIQPYSTEYGGVGLRAYRLINTNDCETLGDYTYDRRRNALVEYLGDETEVTVPGDLIIGGVTLAGTFMGKSAVTKVTVDGAETHLGAGVFYGCPWLRSVDIGEGVDSIPLDCFTGCFRLDSVALPSTIRTVNVSAFRGCQGLTKLVSHIPDPNQLSYTTSIDWRGALFADIFTSRCTLYVPQNTKALYASADNWKRFSLVDEIFGFPFTRDGLIYDRYGTDLAVTGYTDACPAVVSVPQEVQRMTITAIADEAFAGCETLTSVTLPQTIRSIGSRAFAGCTAMNTFRLTAPDPSALTLGEDIFAGVDLGACVLEMPSTDYCELAPWCDFGQFKFRGVELPFVYDGLTYSHWTPDEILVSYADDADPMPEHLEILPEVNGYPVVRIYRETGDNYRGNDKVKSVTIPSGVRYMTGALFMNWTALEEVTLPEGLWELGSSVFNNCPNLKSIKIPECVKELGHTVFYGCRSLKELVIPDGVQKFESSAFAECDSLESVTFGSAVKSMEQYAFYHTKIKSVDLSNVEYLSNAVFWECTELSCDIDLTSATHVGGMAFMNTPIPTVTLGENVQYMGSSAFRDCDNLRKIYCYVSDPSTINTSGTLFSPPIGVPDKVYDTVLYVPQGCKDLYEAEPYWRGVKAIREMCDPVPGDANGDGQVTVSDIVSIVSYILGDIPADFETELADLNGDGDITVSDIVTVVDLILHQTPE